MARRLLGGLVALTTFMALASTAQAGYATWYRGDGTGGVSYQSLPGERPDLQIQVLDSGGTVVIEDRGATITPGTPAGSAANVSACSTESTNVARCTAPAGARFFDISLDLQSARDAHVRDLAGSGQLWYWVRTGVFGDKIDLNYGARYDVRDLGGLNDAISLGPHIGLSEGSYVELGPGTSTVDVANGVFDEVACPGTGLDSITADPGDLLTDCG